MVGNKEVDGIELGYGVRVGETDVVGEMLGGLNLSIEESAKLGADYFGLIAATEDFKAGTGAFLKKKAPVFKGK